MKCPVCSLEMKFVRKFETIDDRNNKKYERTDYWCDKDDVWVTLEIPQTKSN